MCQRVCRSECSSRRCEVSRQCRRLSLWGQWEAAVCHQQQIHSLVSFIITPSPQLLTASHSTRSICFGPQSQYVSYPRLQPHITFKQILSMLYSYPESWRLNRSTSGDTVQLVEQSLDTNLLNNAIKLKFSHCPVLPGGIHIQETLNNVIILICTNQSVHRLLLAHPTRMYRSVSRQYRDTMGYIIYILFIKYGNMLAPPSWSLPLNFWSPHAACNEELWWINPQGKCCTHVFLFFVL